MPNLYEVLGVGRDADRAEIKIAFRSRAKAYHPDLPTGDAERFKAINHAYNILSKPDARLVYDAACGLESARKRRQTRTAAVIMATSFTLTVSMGLLIAGWLRIEGIL
jgi:curved DNA-binding protein CbpA